MGKKAISLYCCAHNCNFVFARLNLVLPVLVHIFPACKISEDNQRTVINICKRDNTSRNNSIITNHQHFLIYVTSKSECKKNKRQIGFLLSLYKKKLMIQVSWSLIHFSSDYFPLVFLFFLFSSRKHPLFQHNKNPNICSLLTSC